jgi:DNA-binding FadR family transcriptional regulator
MLLDLAAIAAQQNEMIAEHNAGRDWRAADLGFHAAIARAAGNAALTAVVERLWQEQHAPVFSLLSERVQLRDNWAATVRGHADILSAIRAGKRKAARDAMRTHLTQVLSVMTGEAGDGQGVARSRATSPRHRTRSNHPRQIRIGGRVCPALRAGFSRPQ